MTLENEQNLIELAKSGDRTAMKTLVEAYAQTVYRFSYNVCRNPDKAEHTTQETFVSVLNKLDQFDNRSKFSTWLYTIVSNHCLMLARSAKNRRFVSLDDEETPAPEVPTTSWDDNPLDRLEREDTRHHLNAAIDKLSPDYRIVFLLRDVEGLSTEEVSAITNLSIPAVKSRLHRARAFLRNELTPIFATRRDS